MASNLFVSDDSDEDGGKSSDGSLLDLAYLDQNDETLGNNLEAYSVIGNSHATTQVLLLNHNLLTTLPSTLSLFSQLTTLDLSSNRLSNLSSFILQLVNLRTLIAKHNNLTSDCDLPKNFESLQLKHLNLAGNHFKSIPDQILQCNTLKTLHLGGNRLTNVPPSIINLSKLETLYLGGNQLVRLPSEIGCLQLLQALYLSENKLETLPPSIAGLRRLKSLALHNNRISTLPPEIIKLRYLTELSLRDNPLVVHFIKDMAYDPPTLLELTARTIKLKEIKYQHDQLPHTLIKYLSHAKHCVNPKCKGVYFDNHVKNIKFVDFCGKYHLPLLQYLCSTNCYNVPAIPRMSSGEISESEDEENISQRKLRKVLLG